MSSALRDPAYRAFVDYLVAMRRRAGLTQRQLATRLKRSQSYVAKCEIYERRLDPAEFRAFIIALEADPTEAFADVSAELEWPDD